MTNPMTNGNFYWIGELLSLIGVPALAAYAIFVARRNVKRGFYSAQFGKLVYKSKEPQMFAANQAAIKYIVVGCVIAYIVIVYELLFRLGLV